MDSLAFGSFVRSGLIVDSWFDQFRGVICLISVVNGTLKPGMKLRSCIGDVDAIVNEVGILSPKQRKLNKLTTGMLGYMIGSIKNLRDIEIGDTLYDNKIDYNNVKPLQSFAKSTPMVHELFSYQLS